jgi:hypothetical protein
MNPLRLMHLPPDLLFKILKKLDVPSLVKFSSINNSTKKLVENFLSVHPRTGTKVLKQD